MQAACKITPFVYDQLEASVVVEGGYLSPQAEACSLGMGEWAVYAVNSSAASWTPGVVTRVSEMQQVVSGPRGHVPEQKLKTRALLVHGLSPHSSVTLPWLSPLSLLTFETISIKWPPWCSSGHPPYAPRSAQHGEHTIASAFLPYFQEVPSPVSCPSPTLGTFHWPERWAPSGCKDFRHSPHVRNALPLTPVNLWSPSSFRSQGTRPA